MPARPLPSDPAFLRQLAEELRRWIEFWQPVIDEIRWTGHRPSPAGPRPMLTLAAPYLGLPFNPADPLNTTRDAWVRKFSDPAVGELSGVVALAIALLDDVLRAIE